MRSRIDQCKLLAVLSQQNHTCVKYYQPGWLGWAVVSKVFIRGQSCWPGAPASLTLATQSPGTTPQPLEVKMMQGGPKFQVHENSSWWVSLLAYTTGHNSRLWVYKITLISGRIFQGFKVTSQDFIRGQSWRLLEYVGVVWHRLTAVLLFQNYFNISWPHS